LPIYCLFIIYLHHKKIRIGPDFFLMAENRVRTHFLYKDRFFAYSQIK
jgi:hypothetical protein